MTAQPEEMGGQCRRRRRCHRRRPPLSAGWRTAGNPTLVVTAQSDQSDNRQLAAAAKHQTPAQQRRLPRYSMA